MENGNQTAIAGYTYSYDAENRMVGAVLSAGATLVSSAGYVYDGSGQRVQKATCWSSVPCTPTSSDATVITYVYDAFGNLAQEYTSYLLAWCGTPTCYLTQDQIGSTRLVTDANGLVGARYDYLPFGEELFASTGGRTATMGYNYGEDYSNPKFAGQMRDPESARDYMGFRYYSPQEGRFVSLDPGNAGADGGDPQTWNGYAYVVNNPLTYTDPNGLGFWSGFMNFWNTVGSILGTGIGIGFGGDDQPWNEQLPITGSLAGDPLNLGGVFGGGNTGPFIFSATPNSGISDATIGPAPLQPDNPMDIVLGPIKQGLSDILNLMSLGRPTNFVQAGMDRLQPNSRLQKTAVLSANIFLPIEPLKRLGLSRGHWVPLARMMVWHHIVEQSKVGEFGSEAINNTVNVVRVTTNVNAKINGYYSKVTGFSEGKTVRDWLKGKSWAQQYNFGLDVLNRALNGEL